MLHHTMPKAWFGCATHIMGTNPSLRSQCLGLLGIIAGWGLLGLASILALPAKSLAAMPASVMTSKTQIQTTYGQLPLHFEANQGQAQSQVQFLSRGKGYGLFLTATEAVLTLRASGTDHPQHTTDPTTKAPDSFIPVKRLPCCACRLLAPTPRCGWWGLRSSPER